MKHRVCIWGMCDKRLANKVADIVVVVFVTAMALGYWVTIINIKRLACLHAFDNISNECSIKCRHLFWTLVRAS